MGSIEGKKIRHKFRHAGGVYLILYPFIALASVHLLASVHHCSITMIYDSVCGFFSLLLLSYYYGVVDEDSVVLITTTEESTGGQGPIIIIMHSTAPARRIDIYSSPINLYNELYS